MIANLLRLRRYYARYVTSFAERVNHAIRRKLNRQRMDILADSEASRSALLLRQALKRLGFVSHIAAHDSYRVQFACIPIVIFSSGIVRIPKKYFILQTRDLAIGDPIEDDYFRILFQAVAVLEYSITNIEYLLAKGISYKKIFYLPLEGDLEFFLLRFLLAMDYLTFSTFYEGISKPLLLDGRGMCLSLPETTERRCAFVHQHGNFTIFDGLRHRYSWVGCGMSYKYLCQRAMAQGLDYLIVVEDDVVFTERYEKDLKVVLSYLSWTRNPWHVFSGFIANLSDNVEVSDVVSYGGIDFVHINRLTSTVFNIYHKSVFSQLSKWDEQNYHFYTNTIDRFLGNWKKLRVVTTLPFLVGHKEDVDSSIWGFNNKRYIPMVEQTLQRLSGLVKEFKRDGMHLSTPK